MAFVNFCPIAFQQWIFQRTEAASCGVSVTKQLLAAGEKGLTCVEWKAEQSPTHKWLFYADVSEILEPSTVLSDFHYRCNANSHGFSDGSRKHTHEMPGPVLGVLKSSMPHPSKMSSIVFKRIEEKSPRNICRQHLTYLLMNQGIFHYCKWILKSHIHKGITNPALG